MKCVTWSGTTPILVSICCFFASTSFYDLNAGASPTQQYPVPQLEYAPGERSKGLEGGAGNERAQSEARYSGGGAAALQGDVYTGDSKVRYKSYETPSSDNSMAASLNYKYGNVVSDYGMELSIPKRRYNDEVGEDGEEDESAKRHLSDGAAKYVYEHKAAAARLAELTQGLYHEDPEVHSALNGDVAGKTFKEAFKGYDKGDVQEQVREMVNKICDTSKSNMELLVNAVQSIEGVDDDGNKHSDKYLKETKVKVATKEHDYSFLFSGKKEVSPQDIVDCYKRLKNEIIEDANGNISTTQKEGQITGLHQILADSFKSYNKSYNKPLGSKNDNFFLNLKNMNDLIEQEDRDMKEVIKHSRLPEKEPEPLHHEVIRAFVGQNSMIFPENIDGYMGASKEDRRKYRQNTDALIKHAADHPSLDMATFLLSSASKNTNSSGKQHSEAIYKYTFTTSDGYQMTIAEAMEMAKNMPDSEGRDRILGDIIRSGIGGYYEKYNALGKFEKSENGFHFSFDVGKLEQDYTHESESVWRKINEAVKNNKKSKDNTSND